MSRTAQNTHRSEPHFLTEPVPSSLTWSCGGAIGPVTLVSFVGGSFDPLHCCHHGSKTGRDIFLCPFKMMPEKSSVKIGVVPVGLWASYKTVVSVRTSLHPGRSIRKQSIYKSVSCTEAFEDSSIGTWSDLGGSCHFVCSVVFWMLFALLFMTENRQIIRLPKQGTSVWVIMEFVCKAVVSGCLQPWDRITGGRYQVTVSVGQW